MLFINHYCHIRKGSLIQQGKVIYENAGTLDNFMEGAYEFLGPSYPKFYKMDRLSKLGFLASELLLKDLSLNTHYGPEQIALVLSNAHSSLDTDVRYLESTKTIASPALFVYTLPNIVAGEICIRHGIKGENTFFVMDKFDASQMSDYIATVMATEKTKACLAGWVDVMGDHHDVFLYLVEKQTSALTIDHTASQLQRIYQLNYGTVNGGS